MKKISILLVLLLCVTTIKAITKSDTIYVQTGIILQTKTGEIFGTLTTPKKFKKIPIALIISGSGPTDRDGNNPTMTNNSLKTLAIELSKNGIASLRYDKRGVGESKNSFKNESDLLFTDYIKDAEEWISLLKKDGRFSKVTVIGHSEGSLIGMLASSNAEKFISIAGGGRSADKVLKEQLSAQTDQIKNLCFPIIDSLKSGQLVKNVDPILNALFRASVQPYMISWFKFDPEVEIGKLRIPILIIQGTNDIQIPVEDAKRLANANPNAKLILVEKMNHVFRLVKGDRNANLATYNNADFPVSPQMVKNIIDFIKR